MSEEKADDAALPMLSGSKIKMKDKIQQFSRKLQVSQRYILKFRQIAQRLESLQKVKKKVPKKGSENNVTKSNNDILEIIDDIYLDEQHKTVDQLDVITDEFKQCLEKKQEPPNYLLSILDRIEKHKKEQIKKAQKEEEEKNSEPLSSQ